MLKRTLFCILLAGSCGLMSAAQAEQFIYKWTDEQGQPKYSELPPPAGVPYETVRKSGFLDELTGTFYIALKDVETNKTIVLEDKITFIDINARDKKAWLVAYVSPATLAKTLNKEKPSVNDIFAVAVSVSGPGIKEEVTGTSPGSPKDWWKSAALTRKNGFVLPKSKTVFAPLWGDRHPMTKD